MMDWLAYDERDEERLAAFMSRVAGLPVSGTGPDPMWLWWKAQLLRRWDAEQRVQAPLEVMERIEIAAGLVAAVVLFFWAAPALVRAVGEPLLRLLS